MKIFLITLTLLSAGITFITFVFASMSALGNAMAGDSQGNGITLAKGLIDYAHIISAVLLVILSVCTVVYLFGGLQDYVSLVRRVAIGLFVIQVGLVVYPIFSIDLDNKAYDQKLLEKQTAFVTRLDNLSQARKPISRLEANDLFKTTSQIYSDEYSLNKTYSLPQSVVDAWGGVFVAHLLDVDSTYDSYMRDLKGEPTLSQIMISYEYIQLFKKYSENYPLTKERINTEKLLPLLIDSSSETKGEEYKEALRYMIAQGADVDIKKDTDGWTARKSLESDIEVYTKGLANGTGGDEERRIIKFNQELLLILEGKE